MVGSNMCPSPGPFLGVSPGCSSLVVRVVVGVSKSFLTILPDSSLLVLMAMDVATV